MEIQKPDLPERLTFAGIEIPVNQQSTLVMALLAVLHKQAAEIQELRDEILRLKKTTTKPIIKPSRLLKPTPSEDDPYFIGPKNWRPGSTKRHKTKELRIDTNEVIKPKD